MNTVNGVTYKSVCELLGNSERWTTGTLARTKNNRPTEVCHISATKFCLLGAIHKIYGNDSTEIEDKIRRILRKKMSSGLIGINNDKMTHKEILEIVKEAKI